MAIEYERKIESQIIESLNDGKVAIIYGARRVGKTTLSLRIAKQYEHQYFNCDDIDVVSKFTNRSSTELKKTIGSSELIIIDEAQKVVNIGNALKLIHDTFPEIKIIATGSSSFDLSNKINEPLTGRANEYELYPLSIDEISTSVFDATRLINHQLVYGMYPEIQNMSDEKSEKYLGELSSRYLFRDAFGPLTKYDFEIMHNLLKLLSFQIGSDVNFNEIGQTLMLNRETIKRYIGLLEDARIIFRLEKYSGNPRTEVSRLRKIYFYDLGIRNGIIDNFNQIELRNDKGALWENYCIIERRKQLDNTGVRFQHYYWRNNNKAEIDLIETQKQEIKAYEFKYSPTKVKFPTQFASKYPDAIFQVINTENIFDDFVKL